METKRFTRKELSLYNGKNGAPSYIAFEGKVYDVTDSFLWQQGNHQVLHEAGTDLTDAMDEAPHSAHVLRGFPIVGVLVDD